MNYVAKPVYVCIHVGQVGRFSGQECPVICTWRRVLLELWKSLDVSGVLGAAQCVYLNAVSSAGRLYRLPDSVASHPKIRWLSGASHVASTYETGTLRALWRAAMDEMPASAHVLYLHTKGASKEHADDARWDEWRRYLLWAVVERWQDCLRAFDHGPYTAAGAEMCWSPQREHVAPFFCGNYWWTTASYLRGLDPRFLDARNRWTAEDWIGTGGGFTPYVVHQVGPADDPDPIANGVLMPGFGRQSYVGAQEAVVHDSCMQ